MAENKVGTNRKAPNNGRGRPKGAQNKNTKALKDAILGALEAKGGQKYLERVAEQDPRTFCTLIGKVLPMQVTGEGDGPLKIEFVNVYHANED